MAGWQWASMYNTSTQPNVIYTNIGSKIESTHWTGNTQKPTTYTSEQIWHGPVSRGTGRERRALRHRRWSGKTQLSSYLPHVKMSSSLQLWTKSAPLSECQCMKWRTIQQSSPPDNRSIVKDRKEVNVQLRRFVSSVSLLVHIKYSDSNMS